AGVLPGGVPGDGRTAGALHRAGLRRPAGGGALTCAGHHLPHPLGPAPARPPEGGLMGGRGAPAPELPEALRLPLTPVHQPPPDPGTYQYVAISSRELPPGGPHYAFLEGLGREWTLVTHDLEAIEEVHPYHSFGMAEPTLRWVKDDRVVDLYVDGMSAEEFFAASGL